MGQEEEENSVSFINTPILTKTLQDAIQTKNALAWSLPQ